MTAGERVSVITARAASQKYCSTIGSAKDTGKCPSDGMCMNLGGNSLGGRVGEDGVAEGIAVCFDEWANSGDHGVMIYYNEPGSTHSWTDSGNPGAVWEDIGSCGNRGGCVPVSYFEDAQWHTVTVTIDAGTPAGGVTIGFTMDSDSAPGGGCAEPRPC